MNGQVRMDRSDSGKAAKPYMYDIDSVKVFDAMLRLFGDSIEMKIIRVLCIKDSCSMRGLARIVGMHHTNLRRYIARLVDAGIVEWESIGNVRVIRLSSEYAFIRSMFR